MGRAAVKYRELRFIIGEDLTDVYIRSDSICGRICHRLDSLS